MGYFRLSNGSVCSDRECFAALEEYSAALEGYSAALEEYSAALEEYSAALKGYSAALEEYSNLVFGLDARFLASCGSWRGTSFLNLSTDSIAMDGAPPLGDLPLTFRNLVSKPADTARALSTGCIIILASLPTGGGLPSTDLRLLGLPSPSFSGPLRPRNMFWDDPAGKMITMSDQNPKLPV